MGGGAGRCGRVVRRDLELVGAGARTAAGNLGQLGLDRLTLGAQRLQPLLGRGSGASLERGETLLRGAGALGSCSARGGSGTCRAVASAAACSSASVVASVATGASASARSARSRSSSS